ncbi:MAG: hypothetical protein ACREQZ_02735, partial [Woeseiaceae bacterium]
MRPFLTMAAAHAVAGAEPRRLGVIASFVVAGAILSAAGSQIENPLLDPAIDGLLPAAVQPAVAETVARSAPFEFVAITIGRNDTLDQIFRGLQLKISDLAELRNLPDVRKSLDM